MTDSIKLRDHNTLGRLCEELVLPPDSEPSTVLAAAIDCVRQLQAEETRLQQRLTVLRFVLSPFSGPCPIDIIMS